MMQFIEDRRGRMQWKVATPGCCGRRLFFIRHGFVLGFYNQDFSLENQFKTYRLVLANNES